MSAYHHSLDQTSIHQRKSCGKASTAWKIQMILNLNPDLQGCAHCRDSKTLLESFSTIAVGAHATTREFLPLLQSGHGKTVINISSSAASTSTFSNLVREVEETDGGPAPACRLSVKSALILARLPSIYKLMTFSNDWEAVLSCLIFQ